MRYEVITSEGHVVALPKDCWDKFPTSARRMLDQEGYKSPLQQFMHRLSTDNGVSESVRLAAAEYLHSTSS